MKKEKVFCLGMSRTGTKSFAVGMKKLGYNPCHNGGRPLTEELLNTYNAFSDSNTCMFHYEYLYNRFPNSMFVFSYRDPEDWADKILDWYNPKHKISYIDWHLNNDYITKVNTRKELINFNKWQYNSIIKFFQDKPSQFLPHCVFKGDTFASIAKLIGVDLKEDFSIHLKDESVKNNKYINI